MSFLMPLSYTSCFAGNELVPKLTKNNACKKIVLALTSGFSKPMSEKHLINVSENMWTHAFEQKGFLCSDA
jgi:hypothetical protein